MQDRHFLECIHSVLSVTFLLFHIHTHKYANHLIGVSLVHNWLIHVHAICSSTSRKLLRIKVTPDLHLTYSKNGGNLGLVLKMKNIACISISLTKHVKYTYLYLFQFVLYSTVAFKAN